MVITLIKSIIGLVIIIIEYPRSGRKAGRTSERKFQGFLANIFLKCGNTYKNYYPRFALYALYEHFIEISLPRIFF